MAKKVLYTLEFPVRCSPQILFEFLATAAGLQEWFADEVNIRGDSLSFFWNGSEERAEIKEKIEDELVRYHWLDAPENEYFEFKITQSEVTNQTVLILTDFAEKGEIEDQSQLWESQLQDLFHRIGA